jgi:hypothetical protein
MANVMIKCSLNTPFMTAEEIILVNMLLLPISWAKELFVWVQKSFGLEGVSVEYLHRQSRIFVPRF